MTEEPECPECVEHFDTAERRDIDKLFGPYHWHCGRCRQIANQQGHYGVLSTGEWGFSCQLPEEGDE